jgi:hypothetical protein
MLVIEIALGIILGYAVITNQAVLLRLGKKALKVLLWIVAILVVFGGAYWLYQVLSDSGTLNDKVGHTAMTVGGIIICRALWEAYQKAPKAKPKAKSPPDEYRETMALWIRTALLTPEGSISAEWDQTLESQINMVVAWAKPAELSAQQAALMKIGSLLGDLIIDLYDGNAKVWKDFAPEYGDFMKDAHGAMAYCDDATVAAFAKEVDPIKRLKIRIKYASGYLVMMAPHTKDVVGLMPHMIADLIKVMKTGSKEGEGSDVDAMKYGRIYLNLATLQDTKEEGVPAVSQTT